MHSGRLRRDLQVHCRAGQCPAPEAPGVLPVLRRSVHLGRIRLLRRGPGGVTPITDTLLPGSFSGAPGVACDGRPRPSTPQPVPRAAGGRGSPWCGGSVPAACHSRPACLPPLVESLPGPEPRRPTTSGRPGMSLVSLRRDSAPGTPGSPGPIKPGR